MVIDKDTIIAIAPNANRAYADALALAISKDGAKYGITSPGILAMFIAQCAHETGGFKWLKESTGFIKKTGKWTGAKATYAPYFGRGFIQITHKEQYADFSAYYFGDDRAVKNPSIVEDPIVGAYASLWWWKYSDNAKRGINQKAATGDIVGVTKLINGGTNGLAERKSYYQKAVAVMKKKIYKIRWRGAANYIAMPLWNYLTLLAQSRKA